MDKKHRGAYNELIATTFLLDLGYDVYRNVSAHGLADLVAINFQTGERLLIDVKANSKFLKRDGSPTVLKIILSKKQLEQGVRQLVVTSDNTCIWSEKE